MRVGATTFAQIDLLQWVRSFLDRGVDRPWAARIELLLIGAVVYTVLRFLQGTRGARLVRAVLIILAVSFAIVWLIAERFEFERINVLYPYFILGVFLVSLLAFQTELRRLLLRLGEGGWLHWLMKGSVQPVDPIVTAVERLAKRKIGALIAVERTTEVGAVTDSGVRIDAKVSAELLETIFWPGTPLHDLGVIIRQGRIVAAGCQFPLAEFGEVERALGSRHRAAVGMSHEADAVVIVVSEETGSISVAVRGHLHKAVSSEGLRNALVPELVVQTDGEMTRPVDKTTAPQPAPESLKETAQDGTG